MTEKKKSFQLFKQNSELEVLISAAIVFTAFVINDIAGDWIIKVVNLNVPTDSPILIIVAIVALYMSAILPVSLISHFILRIYWLSLVGLKSVYPSAQNEEVNSKFDKYVNGSLTLENQIRVLDKICSSIFAFTFLTLFAFCFTFIAVTSIITLLQWIDDPFYIAKNISNLILISGLIYLIDFLTLGRFKKTKNKWFVKIYYPIYRFFGWITFAGLYRGIYYSLIQYASKKVMIIITPVYILIALFLLNQGYSAHTLYPSNGEQKSKEVMASNVFYQDQFSKRMIIRSPFINSFIVPDDQNFIKIYLPLSLDLEEEILEVCNNIEAFNERGFHWQKWIQTDLNRVEYDSVFDYSSNAKSIIECVKENVYITIDSTQIVELNYFFSKINEPSDYAVMVAMIDAKGLERGNHSLTFRSKNESIFTVIPFWRD